MFFSIKRRGDFLFSNVFKISVRFGHIHELLIKAFFAAIAALLRKPKLQLAALSSALAKNNEVRQFR
ncbi:hypothetical protein BKI52_44875 [marine bacterium AO1-C]|nr:hypothetical protein BKI52_44875 [marine bacterium AO1-C]